MPNLLTSGVYIQEVPLGPSPIQGVSTSVAGFVGETVRGPTWGTPSLVVSFADFVNQFGGFDTSKTLAYAIQGFFANAGSQAFVARVINYAAMTTKAMLPLTGGGYLVNVVGLPTALSGGTGTNIALSSVVGLGYGAGLKLIPIAGGASTTCTVVAVNPTSGVVTVSDLLSSLPAGIGPTTYYAQINTAPASPVSVLTVRARDFGFFANQISVYVDAYYSNSTTIAGVSGAVLTLKSVSFLSVNQQVQLDVAGSREVHVIVGINAQTGTVTLDAAPSGGAYAGGKLSLISWRVTVAYQGVPVETFSGLSSALDGGTTGNATAFANGINTQSAWIQIEGPTSTPPATLAISAFGNAFPTFALAQPQLLSGAPVDTPAGPVDVIGVDVPPRTGLKAIEQQDGISIIAAPGFGSGVPVPSPGSGIFDGVVDELIGQAERKLDRVAVFETVDGPNVDVNALLKERGKWNSQYAAMYAPWVTILDPVTGTNINVPPAGHIVGAYANTDNLRGVFKSPANVVLQNIVGFSRDIPTGEQDLLNPAGLNVLRNLPGLGNVIWGARTIAADPLWKYISVRRLFVFIEQSLVQGTRYAVFEPNDLRLWARLRDSVSNFLTTQWRAGALFGATAQQAFFVRIDETTTTQDDRDNGIVNILVGLAPVKPAEFIVFQIGQAPESFIITEQGS